MNRPPALLGIPYDAGSSFLRGPSLAPPVIRRALGSRSANSWSEQVRDVSGIDDAGDIELPDIGNPRVAIEEAAEAVIESGRRPLSLGGDHSVTYPLLRAFRPHHERLTVLHVDAHADLYDEFEGDPYSHACPFARVMEEQLADRLVQVGVRTITGHHRDQAARFGVETIDMRVWVTGARPAVDGDVYLSLDMDALDPAHAPGVSHWEPGGLTTREVVTIIQGIGGRLVGADLVEYNPDRDPSGFTAMVAAKLVKEIACRMLSDE
jgi:arginase